MELLIPGLILVALMAWASTKIKKRAADAFEPELIETESYTFRKPEGFLHVIGDPKHELRAYSREFGEGESAKIRRATIELDVIQPAGLKNVVDRIRESVARVETVLETADRYRLQAEETMDGITIDVHYLIAAVGSTIYRLRFAVLTENAEQFRQKINDSFESFTLL